MRSGYENRPGDFWNFYCFLDDFYSGDNEEIIVNALVLETRKYLDFTVKFNVKDLMSHILQATRVTLSEEEKKQFYDKYIKSMRLAIDDNGDVHVELNS